MGDKVQVFILSQQSLFRQGIEHLLASLEDIEVSGASELNEEVLTNMDKLLPDVALIDVDAPTEDGLTQARRMRQRLPNIGIAVLTSTPNDTQLFEALKAQASAYFGKGITADELVENIKRIAHGEHPINEALVTRPRVADQVLQQFQELSLRSEAEALISPLTPRETEILNHIAEGCLNKQIASRLGISEQTIKNHVTSILRKLNANARTEAVVVALRQGLISITQGGTAK